MAIITPNYRVLSAQILVGADTYTGHIASYKYTPKSTSSEVTDVSGEVHKFAGKSGFDLELVLFQDYSPTGLARKFFTDEGTTVVIKIIEGAVTWTSTITLVAPEIGGTPNQQGTATVTCPSTKPAPTVTA